MRQSRGVWLIDFAQMSLEAASEYLVPFSYVEQQVKPGRMQTRRERRRTYWWLHHESCPNMREAVRNLSRYICSCIVAKHRVWVFQPSTVLPDKALVAVAKDDDFTFGVLHSKLHEVWALTMGTSLEDRPRYTPTTCFETFPFPRPSDTEHVEIEKWAKYLDAVRSQLLAADEKRTMTKVYNDLTDLRETRDSSSPVYALLIAHDKLDAAVAAAYGWKWPMTDDEILAALLALNLERSGATPKT